MPMANVSPSVVVETYKIRDNASWCRRRDSNPYARRHEILILACLPFHHTGIERLVLLYLKVKIAELENSLIPVLEPPVIEFTMNNQCLMVLADIIVQRRKLSAKFLCGDDCVHIKKMRASKRDGKIDFVHFTLPLFILELPFRHGGLCRDRTYGQSVNSRLLYR